MAVAKAVNAAADKFAADPKNKAKKRLRVRLFGRRSSFVF